MNSGIPFLMNGMLFKKRTMKKIFIPFFIFLMCNSALQAQNVDSTKKKEVQIKLSVNYNSGLNYYGRTDSLRSKGVFPLAEVWFNSKFYVNAAPVFVYNSLQPLQYAGGVATTGYVNVATKTITNFYLLKPFYKESSDLVQSALKGQAGASITFLNKGINFTVGGDVKYSDKFDYGASAGIDHIFRIQNKDKSVLVFDPSFNVNAGTQNFSRTYTKKSGGLFPHNNQVTETVQAFNVLSLEASMPIVYSKNRFQVIATPAYVLPKNLLRVEGRPDLSEMGENMFYTTLTVKYSLINRR